MQTNAPESMMRPEQIDFKEKQEGLSRLENRRARNFEEIVISPPDFGYVRAAKVRKKEGGHIGQPNFEAPKLVLHAVQFLYHRGSRALTF
jgi:hypothetical protein